MSRALRCTGIGKPSSAQLAAEGCLHPRLGTCSDISGAGWISLSVQRGQGEVGHSPLPAEHPRGLQPNPGDRCATPRGDKASPRLCSTLGPERVSILAEMVVSQRCQLRWGHRLGKCEWQRRMRKKLCMGWSRRGLSCPRGCARRFFC